MAAVRFVAIAGVVVALIVIGLWAGGVIDVGGGAPAREEVVLAGETFSLELALDPASIARGLMDRTVIPANGGMLFVFADYDRRRFWMKNCVVDIDLLFLDEVGRVVAVHRMKVEPPQGATEDLGDYENRLAGYESARPARFAIELKAGTIDRLGLKTGDRVELDLRRLKRMAR
jgi:uncharacterized membrane protein (UPF0127 family)